MDLLEKENNYLLIDVRDDYEYRNGHIPGAVNIPYQELIQGIKRIVPDVNKEIIVCCEKGYRSKQSVEKLKYIGYKNVHYFGSIYKYTGELVK